MNAAGFCKTLDAVEGLCKIPTLAEVTLGSITVPPRELPAGETFIRGRDGKFFLNSRNLQNMGIDEFLKILPTIAKMVRAAGKKLRVNLAGDKPEDYITLILACLPYADVIELNFGCPNVWGDGKQKPIVSFDLDLMKHIYALIREEVPKDSACKLAVKLSPYSNPAELQEKAIFFRDNLDIVSEYVTSNTFPNGTGWSEDDRAIAPADGYAGVSGPGMWPIAFGQGRRLHELLAPYGATITVVGGIEHGSQIVHLMRRGMYQAQVGSHWGWNGDRVFSDLYREAANCEGVVVAYE